MSEKIHRIFTIPITLSNERIDQALARLMPEYSRTQIKDWLENGSILINGQATKPKMKAKGGEEITMAATIKAQPAWEAEEIPLPLVYEDEAIIVINKPIGMVVHPGTGNNNKTMLNALLHHCPSLQELPRAGILHRLDKDTSGLLVIAKTAKALKNLTAQLKKREIKREYQAVVHGKFISGGKVDANIARHPTIRKRMAVVESGKTAVTHYRILEKYRAHTLLKIQLETGRTHQIRVHMAYIQHPIVGDATYGARVQLAKGMSPELIQLLRRFKRQALHAFALGFMHPVTNEWVQFEIDLPEDIKNLVSLLNIDRTQSTK